MCLGGLFTISDSRFKAIFPGCFFIMEYICIFEWICCLTWRAYTYLCVNVCFNVFNQVKNKKFVLHSVNFVEGLFPGNYKGLQITQKLTCRKRVVLPSTSTFGKQYTWYKIIRTNCCITCSIGS